MLKRYHRRRPIVRVALAHRIDKLRELRGTQLVGGNLIDGNTEGVHVRSGGGDCLEGEQLRRHEITRARRAVRRERLRYRCLLVERDLKVGEARSP